MNYLKIDKDDECNGDGLRVILWLSGCSHHCKECQNPQTWNPDSGILFDDLAEEELFKELNKDCISGMTLTGGDPLHESNLDGVLELVNKTRLLLPEKTIWLYTGYTWEECQPNTRREWFVREHFPNDKKLLNESIIQDKRAEIVENIDVMVDGRYIDSRRDITLAWRGSKNQRVIDTKKSLQKGEVVLWTN